MSLDHVYQLQDPDDAIAHRKNTVYNAFHKHVPVKDVCVKHQEKSPRITTEVLEIMRERDAAHKNIQRYYHLPQVKGQRALFNTQNKERSFQKIDCRQNW